MPTSVRNTCIGLRTGSSAPDMGLRVQRSSTIPLSGLYRARSRNSRHMRRHRSWCACLPQVTWSRWTWSVSTSGTGRIGRGIRVHSSDITTSNPWKPHRKLNGGHGKGPAQPPITTPACISAGRCITTGCWRTDTTLKGFVFRNDQELIVPPPCLISQPPTNQMLLGIPCCPKIIFPPCGSDHPQYRSSNSSASTDQSPP